MINKGGCTMSKPELIDLILDLSQIKDHEAYRELWKRLGKIKSKWWSSMRSANMPSAILSSMKILIKNRPEL
jgi:hypothetical protein